jgi:hypothetical protein
MRRVTSLSSGLRPTSQSSFAYIHEAARHQLSNSIPLSQRLAASWAPSYPKGFEAIAKPLRSPIT